jgi:hypothetical protein
MGGKNKALSNGSRLPRGKSVTGRGVEWGETADLEDLDNAEAELKRLHAQLGEKNRLRAADPLSRFAELHARDDLNVALGDLGCNAQRLEERGLRRLQTGDAGLQRDIEGSDRASFGCCRDLRSA